ncbi:MAG TPA: alpha/beta fold hydrolase [Solirubrobacterales bacterium]|jgi:hypothetical protein
MSVSVEPREGQPGSARRRGGGRRRVAVAALLLLVVVVAAVAVMGWRYSSLVLVPNHEPGPFDVKVLAVEGDRITLERDADTERPGTYGLDWRDGHAIVGRVLAARGDTVTRRLRAVEGRLEPGTEVELDPHVWEGDPRRTIGLEFDEVEIEGELGPMPAWQVDPPRPSDAWAIFVHGLNGTREAALRVLPTLRRAGLTALAITYRNDEGAPPSPDGKHHLGLEEWRDLEAAARYALERGAERLVLIGYSMGGAIVTQFAERSELADRVAALVLDSPALSWKPVLDYGATELGLPELAAVPVRWAIALRIDVDWDQLDALQHTGELSLPTLLFHGTEDTVVPIELSEEYARALPEHVTYYHVPRAGHVESWNVDPAAYEGRLRAFLADLGLDR